MILNQYSQTGQKNNSENTGSKSNISASAGSLKYPIYKVEQSRWAIWRRRLQSAVNINARKQNKKNTVGH